VSYSNEINSSTSSAIKSNTFPSTQAVVSYYKHKYSHHQTRTSGSKRGEGCRDQAHTNNMNVLSLRHADLIRRNTRSFILRRQDSFACLAH